MVGSANEEVKVAVESLLIRCLACKLHVQYLNYLFTSLTHITWQIWWSSGASKIVVENCYTFVSEYSSKIYPLLYAYVFFVRLWHVIVIVLVFDVWSTLVFSIMWLDVCWLVMYHVRCNLDSVRDVLKLGTWRMMEVIISVTHVHTNKWVVVDTHHVSVLPIFHPIIIRWTVWIVTS
jgi:hypothetical protein